MPMHGGIVEWWSRGHRVCMIQAERHADREAKATVFSGPRYADHVREHIRRAVYALTFAIFQVDQCHRVVLPRHFGRKTDIVPASLAVAQLWIAYIETQVGKRGCRTVTGDGFTVPGCYKGNFYGKVPLIAGRAKGCERQDEQVASGQLSSLFY